MGMPGVSTWNFGEAFAHLYLDSVAMNHNSIGRGYETFGNGSAETEKRSDLCRQRRQREWYRPLLRRPRSPLVSPRQSQLPGNRCARRARRCRQRTHNNMLRNFYKKSWDSWQKGLTEPPYAFLIPQDQGDPARVAAMVERLMAQRIEVSRAQTAIQIKEGNFPPEPTSSASTSPTETTPSTCSPRSAIPKMASRPTTTFPGSSPPTIICKPSPPPTPQSAKPR